LKEIKLSAASLGLEIFAINVSSAAGLDLSLGPLLSKIDTLYVSECSAGCKGFEKIIHRASEAKVPVISQIPSSAHRGALISLEISPEEQGQLAGESAVKVLNGRIINNIPIATPKKTDMIVNLRAARNLDLHIPFQVLSAATRVLK
jgi:putative ABC transport system substrate-binding protein